VHVRFSSVSLVLVIVILVWAGPVFAVNVPGDYPTIQAALDAGATQILVADGTYHEVLSVTHTVVLLPQPPSPWDQPLPFPKVDGISITINSSTDSVCVRGFHFTGAAIQHNSGLGGRCTTRFESCWLDAGFQTQGDSGLGLTLLIRNCLLLGDLYAHLYYPTISDNVVVGGGITAWANGGGSVTGNLVIGPAAVGLSMPSVDVGSTARGNTIRNVQDGIVASMGIVDSNRVVDCTGTAYKDLPAVSGGVPSFTNNVALRCGGYGFDIPQFATIDGNVVDSVGLAGIHVAAGAQVLRADHNTVSHTSGHGIWAEGHVLAGVTGNTVRFAGGDGIRARDPADSNVVGRCTGRGIVAPSARHNTCYLNGDAGLELNGTAADSITHDIAYDNGGPGLRWTGTGTPFRGCNDWCLNSGGATSGIAVGATDLAVDPQFCDLAADLVALASASPLANAAGCGRIGALGVGCTTPVGVASEAPVGATGGLEVQPLPASRGLVLSWAADGRESLLEVYDVLGALRWSRRVGAGTSLLGWDGTDASGVPLAPGTYFARRTAGQRTETARVVIIR
jgi:hypothetical protein